MNSKRFFLRIVQSILSTLFTGVISAFKNLNILTVVSGEITGLLPDLKI
jgi:hypothetical protein